MSKRFDGHSLASLPEVFCWTDARGIPGSEIALRCVVLRVVVVANRMSRRASWSTIIGSPFAQMIKVLGVRDSRA
jgi:hypothetical protein